MMRKFNGTHTETQGAWWLQKLTYFIWRIGGGEGGRKAQIKAVVDFRLMVNKLISIIKFRYRLSAPSERQLWATVIAIFKKVARSLLKMLGNGIPNISSQ
jgi:hypothetical protein